MFPHNDLSRFFCICHLSSGPLPLCSGYSEVCRGEAAQTKWLHESVQHVQIGGGVPLWREAPHEGKYLYFITLLQSHLYWLIKIAFHDLNPFPLRAVNNKREYHQKAIKVIKSYCSRHTNLIHYSPRLRLKWRI